MKTHLTKSKIYREFEPNSRFGFDSEPLVLFLMIISFLIFVIGEVGL